MKRRTRDRGGRATRRRVLLAALATGALLALPAPAAHAAWESAQLASVHNGRLEQADGPTVSVDLSGDGRWVVFQARATNFFADDDPDPPGRMRQGGVFRFDRTSGAIELVADGDEADESSGEVLRRGATSPSVSDDGRWVAFATAQPLVPADVNDAIDVYVRDMSVPTTGFAGGAPPDRVGSGAYRLVSARDGGDWPASYAPPAIEAPGRNPGTNVYAGHAISGDGRFVAFRTTEVASDLPDRAGLDTPPGSVFVRDLETRRTALVSHALDGGGPVGGALAPVVLSRDGSTVAWVGQNAPAQTRFLTGEVQDAGQRYYLWRRWADADARTRRITGLADPDDPACTSGQLVPIPTATGPCYGPLAEYDAGLKDIGSRAPALSADGWTVAFLSGAAPRPTQSSDAYLDVYTTSMRPGVTRKAGTQQLTGATTAANARVNGDIESVGIAGDASRLVLVTTRREFLSPTPPMIGLPAPSLPTRNELYAVDLVGAPGIRRVLTPNGGEVNEGFEPNPVLSHDGRTLAVVSRASNLVRGDANEQPDAFVTADVERRAATAPPVGLGRDPVAVEVVGESDVFDVSARALRDGRVAVRVVVTGAGSVAAVASTRPVRVRSRARTRRAAGRRSRARTRRAAGRRTAARRGRTAATRPRIRQVASASISASALGPVRLTLRPSRRDLLALRRGERLPVRVAVTFRPSDGGRTRRGAVNTTLRHAIARRRAAGRRAGTRRPAARQRP